MWIEQPNGRSKEALLLRPRSNTTVSAVAQISEVTQERRPGRGTRGLNNLFLQIW